MKEKFDLLNLPTTANLAQVKKAFRVKALQMHPDKNPDDPQATSKFQELNTAYSFLSSAFLSKKLETGTEKDEEVVLSQPREEKFDAGGSQQDPLRAVNAYLEKLFNQDFVFRLVWLEMESRRRLTTWVESDGSQDFIEMIHELSDLIYTAQGYVDALNNSSKSKEPQTAKKLDYLQGVIQRASWCSKYFLYFVCWRNYPSLSPEQSLDIYKYAMHPAVELQFGYKKVHLFDFYKQGSDIPLEKRLMEKENFIEWMAEFKALNKAIISKMKQKEPINSSQAAIAMPQEIESSQISSVLSNEVDFKPEPMETNKHITAKLQCTAIELFERIDYLITLSKQGFTDSSPVGSICTLLSGKHIEEYNKQSALIIESLSKLEEIPASLFEKPFFYPFSTMQLKSLKEQCWMSKTNVQEQRLISVYEKILAKQQSIITDVSLHLENHFKSTLHSRILILNAALVRITKEKIKVKERQDKPGFFDNASNAAIKYNQLRVLEYNLGRIKDLYLSYDKPDFNPTLTIRSIASFFQATEQQIHEAFSEAKKPFFLKEIQTHNNPLMRVLDAIYYIISLGFGHISTETESVIEKSFSLINNTF